MPGCNPKIFPSILLNDAPEGSGLNSNDNEPRSRPAIDSQSTEKSAAINNLGSELTPCPRRLSGNSSLFKAISGGLVVSRKRLAEPSAKSLVKTASNPSITGLILALISDSLIPETVHWATSKSKIVSTEFEFFGISAVRSLSGCHNLKSIDGKLAEIKSIS